MSNVANGLLRAVRRHGAVQPRVGVAGGLLAVAHADRDGALAQTHVAAPEHAGTSPHQRTPPPSLCDPTRTPHRLRILRLVELHQLDLRLRASHAGSFAAS
jgi:hypothetical protein